MPFREILNRLMTPGERVLWEACLARNACDYRKGEDMVREGEHPRVLHVVLSGWVQKYKELPDGRRQILAIYMPGQLCDLDLFTVARSDHSLAAVRAASVAEISRPDACALLRRCPNITQIFCWSELVAAAVQREWMISLGQRHALERVAHLLCEIYVRQRGAPNPDDGECDFFLTQWQIAEATGLTQVHVNRTVQELRRRCGVELGRLRLRVPDFAGLSTIAAFNPNYLHFGEAGAGVDRVAPLFETADVPVFAGFPTDGDRAAPLGLLS